MDEQRYRLQARWIGSDIKGQEALTQAGDIAVDAENYHSDLIVRCPICDEVHLISINKDTHHVATWQFNERTLTLNPSAKITSYYGVCHWTLTNGLFVIWPDSTASKESVANAKSMEEKEFSKITISKGAS
jgi:uncharacterized protein DUF6527